jgi:nicotinamidase/pyrazinamidase
VTTPTALIAVDVQGTFADDFPGAGLPVPGSGAIVDAIREFTVAAAASPDVLAVVTSQDWHPEKLPGHMVASPADEPDFANKVFTRHGIAGTAEAELHPSFATGALAAVVTDQVKKGQAAAAFSAFEGTDEYGRSLDFLLREKGVRRLVVYGFELANCVSATAVDGARAGYETVVVPDLCSVLDPGRLGAALDALRREGVRTVALAEIGALLGADVGAPAK